MQGLQHEPVTAERDDGIRRARLGIAVSRGKALQGEPRLRHVAGNESDFLEFLG